MVVRLSKTEAKPRTAADVIRELGNIPPDRILLNPPIGTAKVKDLLDRKGVELIDGTLVEKAMGWRESVLAYFLGRLIGNYLDANDLGVLAGTRRHATRQASGSIRGHFLLLMGPISRRRTSGRGLSEIGAGPCHRSIEQGQYQGGNETETTGVLQGRSEGGLDR